MKFDGAVEAISTITDLRRIAGAHVVDRRQLEDSELRAAIVKVKPQYLDVATVHSSLEDALYRDERIDHRVLSRIILADVLLDEYEFTLRFGDLEKRVLDFEQSIVNRSNETEILDLAAGNKDGQRYRDMKLYEVVLNVAWENDNTKSPDEVNLLRKLRDRLKIPEVDHRILEAKVGKYPRFSNELHSRTDINEVRRNLQGLGLLFAVRQDGVDWDMVPEELASVLRNALRLEIRTESYRQLLAYRPLRRKPLLVDTLTRNGVEFGRSDTIETLADRVLQYVPPSKATASSSPRYGLNSEQLASWCRDLNISAAGTIEDRVSRIIEHFDQLRPTVETEIDERMRWYEFYEELASRNYDRLRAQHVIDKDLEIEAKFEQATRYIFAHKLRHTPLQQRGSNVPDGLLSLQSGYLMWDNKSKESPVILKDHIAQFDAYMNQAEKDVPIFLVIGPEFTAESEADAVRYHAQHFDRNFALITAVEIKQLAEEWSSEKNRKRDDPFQLGLLAATGRYGTL